MEQKQTNIFSYYFHRILNLCRSNPQNPEDVSTTTIYNNEAYSPETTQIQELRTETLIEDNSETVKRAPQKTYSEILKQPPKQNNEQENSNEWTVARGRRRNRGNMQEKNRGGNRAGRSNRSRRTNRGGTGRGQYNNTNFSSNNEDTRPRGRGGYRGRRGFVHGGINKSNSFRSSSSGIFSYTNAFCKTTNNDENKNAPLHGAKVGQPIIFNYYTVKNYVMKDGPLTEVFKTGSSTHFLEKQ